MLIAVISIFFTIVGERISEVIVTVVLRSLLPRLCHSGEKKINVGWLNEREQRPVGK
ncbi:hypothetical protein [Nostoc sp.]|uniref:hypothetical protein n=1 Tax=Nostoc sp. TaxID=1180 RepID=UPI002FFA40EF